MKVGDVVDGRYKLLELLGEGAAGKVFRAEDRGKNQVFIALKLLHAKDPRWEGFFRREFEVLSKLHHPNLVRVYDFGPAPEENTYYFTQELVVGSPLLDVVAGKKLDEVCGLFIEICRALEFIHAHGVLHRDLKPANILVQRHADPGERVRVLDFGLWRELDTTPQKGARWAGTPPYLASEVLRGFGHSISADLYAVGVTLFQGITRKLPHGRGTPQELLQARKDPAPSLKGIVPDGLAELVSRLLHEEADRRPQSAAEVATALSVFVPNQALTMPVQLGRARLVGRDVEREQIEAAILAVRERRPDAKRLVVVRAAKGAGKSRLVNEIKAHTQLTGGRSAIGRALENVRAPYRPIAEIVRAFTPATEAVGLRPDERAVVERLVPELARDPMSIDLHVAESERARFNESISALFLGFAKKETTVLIVEDAPFLDVASTQFLVSLLRRAREAAVLVVVTASTDPEAGPLPKELVAAAGNDVLTVHLKPLGRDDTAKLAAALLGVTDVSPTLVDVLVAHANGNPLLIEELISLFIDRGDLIRAEVGWRFDAFDDAATVPGPLPPKVASAFTALADDEDQHCALSALAVFARPANAKLIGAIAGLDDDEVHPALESALASGLIRIVEPQAARPRYVFTSPKISDALLTELTNGEVLTEWHLTAAEVLEERARSKNDALAELVAHHYEVAGEHAHALTWLERAMARGIAQATLENALELSRRAARLLASESPTIVDVDPEQRGRILLLSGQALLHLGRVAEARAVLEEAVTQTPADLAPASLGALTYTLARAHHAAGMLDLGRRTLDETMAKVDARRSPELMARMLLARAELKKDSDPAAAVEDTERGQALLGAKRTIDDEVFALEVLTHARREDGATKRALEAVEKRRVLAEKHDRVIDRISALRDQAAILAQRGDRLGARNHLTEAHRLARERGAPREEAALVELLGEQLYVSGAFSEAIPRYQQAATLFAQMGMELARARAILGLGLCYSGKGDYERAVDHLRNVVDTFDRTGSQALRIRTRARLAEALGARTELDEADRVIADAEALLPARGLDPTRAELCTAKGHIGVARGDFDRARSSFLRAIVHARRAESQLALGEAVTGYAQALLREKLPRRASRMVKRAETIFINLDARGQMKRIAPLINAAEGLSSQTQRRRART
jgi:tetratricopeptide (TPR) repeat protein